MIFYIIFLFIISLIENFNGNKWFKKLFIIFTSFWKKIKNVFLCGIHCNVGAEFGMPEYPKFIHEDGAHMLEPDHLSHLFVKIIGLSFDSTV